MRGFGVKLLVLWAGLGLLFSVAFAGEIRYDSSQIRDPFIPLRISQADGEGLGQNGLTVEGIVFDPRGSSYAVIGGEIYKEGEELKGTKIVKIMPDRVIFFQGNEEVTSWIREEVVHEKKEE